MQSTPHVSCSGTGADAREGILGRMEQRMTAKATARAATRASLLEAATRLILESPAADPIGALRPVEVARRADPPRTNGAFYNIWPTQAEFRRDLLHHLLDVERLEVGEDTTRAATALLQAPEFDLAEACRVLGNLNFEGLRDDPGYQLKQALWTRHPGDPETRELLGRLYAGVTTMLTPMYAAILHRSGRRMRAPYTLEHLAVALAALAEGVHTRWAVDPGAVPEVPPPAVDGAGRWTFFASVAFTTLVAMTEEAAPDPRPDGTAAPDS